MREELTLVGFLFAALGCVTGCSGNGDEASHEETTTAAVTDSTSGETPTTRVTTTSEPTRCLDAAGLSGVKQRAAGVWSGTRAGRHYAIVVHELRKPATAPTVVAGTYAITGSFKVAAEGRELTVQEGLEADAWVEIVADCLDG